MKKFLISIKGKFSDLKPDFMKFHGRYSKSFFYEILPFLPFYKVIVVDNFECCTEFTKSRQHLPA